MQFGEQMSLELLILFEIPTVCLNEEVYGK